MIVGEPAEPEMVPAPPLSKALLPVMEHFSKEMVPPVIYMAPWLLLVAVLLRIIESVKVIELPLLFVYCRNPPLAAELSAKVDPVIVVESRLLRYRPPPSMRVLPYSIVLSEMDRLKVPPPSVKYITPPRMPEEFLVAAMVPASVVSLAVKVESSMLIDTVPPPL